jgi:hypothetical protein
MKIKVLLLVAVIASLFALFAAQGIIPSRGGVSGSSGATQAPVAAPRPPHWF